MRIVRAGDIYHLELNLDINICKDVHFDEDYLKLMIEGCVRSFFNDPYFVDGITLEKGEQNG